MKNAVDDASTVSDHIQFETSDDTFVIKASGDLGSVTIDVGKESEEILGFEVKEASKAMFSLSYLSEMIKAASNVSDIVTIEFSTDMPVRLNFELPQSGRLQYYLAPRIDI
jgi:proliferating cell nuclear antigen